MVLACMLVLVATFPWGDLQGHGHWTRVVWVPFATRRIRILDIGQNFLLYMPLGGFTGRLFRRRPMLMTFAFSLILAGLAESAQVYSHTRFPSMTDVTCNVAGALSAAAITRRRR
jgi:glycopeptide antibiotics resistance protein